MALPLALLATMTSPAAAQSMERMPGMPGMTMPSGKPSHPAIHRSKPKKPATTQGSGSKPLNASGGAPAMSMPMDMPMPAPAAAGDAGMSGMAMDHSGHAMPAMDMPPSGTDLAPGNAAPPPIPTSFYADRTSPTAEMDAARAQMMHEQGGQNFHQVMFNLAEAQFRNGRDGYRWDGEGWFGGDINRAWIKSEGSGSVRDGVDAAEVQALFSHAIGPYFNLQGGVRHDFAPTPTRTYASVGVEGLAPYMFQIEARGFVATTGQVLGRVEGWYDQRLTQRLVLQPRVELNVAAQDDAPTRTGAGLSDAELGLRLRYELVREFAPYVGISYDAKTGHTADYARADGHKPTQTSFVAGVRFWF